MKQAFYTIAQMFCHVKGEGPSFKVGSRWGRGEKSDTLYGVSLLHHKQSGERVCGWGRVVSIDHTCTKSRSDEHRRGCCLADELRLLARIERGRRNAWDTRCFSHKQMNRARSAPLFIVAHLVNVSHEGVAFIATDLALRPSRLPLW